MNKQEKPLPFTCPLCRGEISSMRFLIQHISSHHPLDVAETLAELVTKERETIPVEKIKEVVFQMHEDYIPVERIQALIAKFEPMYADKIKDGKVIDYESWDYIDQARLLTVQYLKDLLASQARTGKGKKGKRELNECCS